MVHTFSDYCIVVVILVFWIYRDTVGEDSLSNHAGVISYTVFCVGGLRRCSMVTKLMKNAAFVFRIKLNEVS